MVIKVNATDVYKITQSCSCAEMYEMFETCCKPELMIFAPQKVGAGFFQWELPGEGWNKLSEADSLDLSDVTGALLKIKEELRPSLSQNRKINVDNIFTTPSDDYVFYKYEGNELRVMLAAWDYKFPVKPIVGSVVLDGRRGKSVQNVSLFFVKRGSAAPNEKFSFVTHSGRKKEVETDENGYFQMGDLLVGKRYDIYVSGFMSSFPIIPEKGRQEYEIDVTEPYTLNISASFDGEPLRGEQAIIRYGDQSYEAVTGEDGRCHISFPYKLGATCEVEVRNDRRSICLNYPLTEVEFGFMTEQTNVSVLVLRNGRPYGQIPVQVVAGSVSTSFLTDADGRIKATVPYQDNTELLVKAGDQTQNRPMAHGDNDFVIEITETEFNDIGVIVRNDDYEAMVNYPVSVDVDGTHLSGITASDGVFHIGTQQVGKTMVITDGNDDNNFVSYQIVPEENEYLLRVHPQSAPKILITAVDNKNRPLADKVITLNQGEKKAILSLDESGSATLSKGIFATGTSIESSLSENGVTQVSFDLVLDENEDEYLIVFKQRNNAWWKILLNILFALLIIYLVASFLVFIFDITY